MAKRSTKKNGLKPAKKAKELDANDVARLKEEARKEIVRLVNLPRPRVSIDEAAGRRSTLVERTVAAVRDWCNKRKKHGLSDGWIETAAIEAVALPPIRTLTDEEARAVREAAALEELERRQRLDASQKRIREKAEQLGLLSHDALFLWIESKIGNTDEARRRLRLPNMVEEMLDIELRQATRKSPRNAKKRAERFRPNACPKCNGKSRVTSTRDNSRSFKCGCGYTWTRSRVMNS